MRVRYSYPTGSTLGYSIERLSDGLFFDFADQTFKATPTTTVAPLPEDSSDFKGRYKVTLTSTPVAKFTDGQYMVTVHDRQASNTVVAELLSIFQNGDDSPTFAASSTVGATADPWSALLPGAYPAGTAGAILGQNLDARVSTRSTFDGGVVAGVTAPVKLAIDPWSVQIPGSYPAGSAGAVLGQNIDARISTRSTFDGGVVAGVTAPVKLAIDPWSVQIPGSYPAGSAGAVLGQNIDARISTRSTFDGGVVAGVTAPVTVGTVTDKSGYLLASAGLDAIAVEAGVNARQALAPILAASAGVVAGGGYRCGCHQRRQFVDYPDHGDNRQRRQPLVGHSVASIVSPTLEGVPPWFQQIQPPRRREP